MAVSIQREEAQCKLVMAMPLHGASEVTAFGRALRTT